MMLIISFLLALTFHHIPLKDIPLTKWTHVCTIGTVVYVRKQQDGDIHLTLIEGSSKLVLEIIPTLPLPSPKKGMKIQACGITRYDKHHQWDELHPLLNWKEMK